MGPKIRLKGTAEVLYGGKTARGGNDTVPSRTGPPRFDHHGESCERDARSRNAYSGVDTPMTLLEGQGLVLLSSSSLLLLGVGVRRELGFATPTRRGVAFRKAGSLFPI